MKQYGWLLQVISHDTYSSIQSDCIISEKSGNATLNRDYSLIKRTKASYLQRGHEQLSVVSCRIWGTYVMTLLHHCSQCLLALSY